MSKTSRFAGIAAHPFSRRNAMLGVMAGAVGTTAAKAAGTSAPSAGNPDMGEIVDLSHMYDFYGTAGQAGIQTPPQRHAFFMTFDLTTQSRNDLQVLLALWSSAIAQLVKGGPIGQVEPSSPDATGFDTGEATNLGPASLTVTIGLGPKIFTEQFGLAGQRPALLRPLPQLPSDALDPNLTGGDLSLQACSDDPQVSYHAIRDLARIAKRTGSAATRWAVLGFGRASAGHGQSTPRNLLGFKDGTRNISEPEDFERFVWVKDGPDWQHYGSYQVVRKIKMRIENWDTDRIGDQNNIFGRHKLSGAPLTGKQEFDTPDFTKTGADGKLIIPATAHISLAAHENNNGIKILRRSYNYTDGINEYGQLDAGLLFVSYQNNPAHFEQIQTRLGSSDALNEYIEHIGSGIFFVPPAPQIGNYIAQGMFT